MVRQPPLPPEDRIRILIEGVRIPMKSKLTVSIDEDLVPEAKRFARSRGVSLSQLIEEALREEMAPSGQPGFAERWRGELRLAERDDDRYRRLTRKYL
jgi:post-segregation antitoxin (ccd killing protein)